MTPATTVRRTFSALSVRNFRLFILGQCISLSGTWMQTLAQALLVLRLTGRGTAVGLVVALQCLPLLFLPPLGGALADRLDRRRILMGTQIASGLLALCLGLLVATDVVELWMVFVLAFGLGIVNAFDNPARQSFVFEMVGPDKVTNAVSLNSVSANLARVVGPALGGLIIATVGLATCFLYNAASFVAVLVGLALMRPAEMHHAPAGDPTKNRIRDGIRYVRATPELLAPLLVLTAIGVLAWEFQVSLPLMAEFVFHGDAGTLGAMMALMGGGAVTGGLVVASRRHPSTRRFLLTSMAFGVTILLAATAPTLPLELVAMVPLGAFGVAVIAQGNTVLQLTTSPEMRGRVMSLWTIALLGTTTIGGPAVGWIGDHVGPRYGLGIGGVTAIVAAALAYPTLARQRQGSTTEPSAIDLEAAYDPRVELAIADELELKG